MSPGAVASVAPLALHRDAIPVLCGWFEAEWSSYYGPGGPGDARRDLETYANQGSLPVGVVALSAGRVCGVAALRAQSVASLAHLSPWAAAGLVFPSLRGRGIGRLLLRAVEEQAQGLGFGRIYCATATAASLLERCDWQLVDRIDHEGTKLALYVKAL